MFTFSRLSFAKQFLAANFVILLIGMTVIGYLVGEKIEAGVIHQTASVTALYVDSFISPLLQDLSQGKSISAESLQQLESILSDSPLGKKIVSFKVWSSDGQILFSPNPAMVGKYFSIGEGLQAGLSGDVVSVVSNLESEENFYERERYDLLIETYAPVRANKTGEIIAISEFYQLPDELFKEIQAAQLQSWSVVGIATLVMYLLFSGMVGRASITIDRQNSMLRSKIAELTESLEKNRELNRRVREAASRTTSLNEQFLRRIASDLHDGPIQDIALSLLRIEAVAEACNKCQALLMKGSLALNDLSMIRSALESSIRELRLISSGLRLPELEDLGLVEVVERAIREFERKTTKAVGFEYENLPETIRLPTKITLYRVIQEALFNGFRHAGGTEQHVRLWDDDGKLYVEVTDNGVGFNEQGVPGNSHLGLVGMRERIEVLGGSFSIASKPEQGTTIRAMLPLEEHFEYA